MIVFDVSVNVVVVIVVAAAAAAGTHMIRLQFSHFQKLHLAFA